jgi:hypothetical protein
MAEEIMDPQASVARWKDIYISARMGDLERVRYLVEVADVAVNTMDVWDATPLYYACLCGHFELAKYLLAHGARCEEDTFEGERCFYAALNPELKNLLKSYKLSAATRDPLCEWLRQLFISHEFADITFIVCGCPHVRKPFTFCRCRCRLALKSKSCMRIVLYWLHAALICATCWRGNGRVSELCASPTPRSTGGLFRLWFVVEYI